MTDVKFPVNVSKIDFNDIKQSFISYLQTKPEMQDFMFSGSGWQYLLDALAWNTAFNAFYLNMVGSEMFLDSAQLFDSVYSKAKLLGYLPRSKRSSRATIELKIAVQGANIPAQINIPKTAALTGVGNDGKTYQFLVSAPKTLYYINPAGGPSDYDPDTNAFYTELDIVEGFRLTQTFILTTDPHQKIVIPNPGVDVDSLVVKVQESATNFQTYLFTRAADVTQLKSDSKVYYLQYGDNKLLEIYFGDGILSAGFRIVDTEGTIETNGLAPGNLVIVEYMVCNGSIPNTIKAFTPVERLGAAVPETIGLGPETITTTVPATGGEEEESLDSVRNIAPLDFEMQNRAVTKSDFQQVILKDYPRIDSIAVWGGEENDPPRYGNVFLSMKPSEGFVLSATDKDYIINTIVKKQTTLCVQPIIVDPDYLYLIPNTEVKFNSKQSTMRLPEIQYSVYQTVKSYSGNYLEKFNRNFILSQFSQLISAVDTSIFSNLTNLTLKKIIYPTIGVEVAYTIDFVNPIKVFSDENIYNKAVYSSSFYYPDLSTVCLFAEQSLQSDVLSLFRVNSSTNALVKVQDVGTVNYNTGRVTIDQIFSPAGWLANENRIEFYAKPDILDIDSARNTILVIDPLDIRVQVVDEIP